MGIKMISKHARTGSKNIRHLICLSSASPNHRFCPLECGWEAGRTGEDGKKRAAAAASAAAGEGSASAPPAAAPKKAALPIKDPVTKKPINLDQVRILCDLAAIPGTDRLVHVSVDPSER